jgi:hypothetical protein
MYRGWLLSAGVINIFPALKHKTESLTQQSNMLISMSNKAKKFLHWKSKDSKVSSST